MPTKQGLSVEGFWSKKKPKLNFECILITANKFRDGWEYTLYTVERVEYDDKWYWGLICADGEEWGDLSDLKAQRYLILPTINQQSLLKQE